MWMKPSDFAFVNKSFELLSHHFKNYLATLMKSILKRLRHFNVLKLIGDPLLTQYYMDFVFDFIHFFLTIHLFWMWIHPRNFTFVKMSFKFISSNSKRECMSLMFRVARKHLFNFKILHFRFFSIFFRHRFFLLSNLQLIGCPNIPKKMTANYFVPQ